LNGQKFNQQEKIIADKWNENYCQGLDCIVGVDICEIMVTKEDIRTLEAFKMWVKRYMEKIIKITWTEKITSFEVLKTLMWEGESMGTGTECEGGHIIWVSIAHP